jgi:NADPH:quinone reductase-like Zn-dependent oxidoreductase
MRVLRINGLKESIKYELVDKVKLTKSNDILIKVLYSPINPSDMGFIANIYGKSKYNKYPKPLGFEGCGIIDSANDKSLIGKKVVFTTDYEREKYV